MTSSVTEKEGIIVMKNIRELYNNFIVKLQELTYTIGAAKRVQVMSEYVDIRSDDVILDIGGNTGKVTEAYSNNCKEVVVLEPKRNVVEYGKSHRPNIKFVEGEAENIPLPDAYFDKVVASASFHHFSDHDKALEEMKRVLKPDGKIIILEIDPNTRRGECLKFCETVFHTGAKLYQPAQLSKKIQAHNLEVLSIDSTTIGYFLTAVNRS
ncbi:MAG TPA: class I SAM-dependent methyltransferase [Nitrososphaeraceae archaeon]|nr:class I SAM-dependent methyltransferase [Nitrososphaeraceae archaeon]